MYTHTHHETKRLDNARLCLKLILNCINSPHGHHINDFQQKEQNSNETNQREHQKKTGYEDR